jgi:hypothetical protein
MVLDSEIRVGGEGKDIKIRGGVEIGMNAVLIELDAHRRDGIVGGHSVAPSG